MAMEEMTCDRKMVRIACHLIELSVGGQDSDLRSSHQLRPIPIMVEPKVQLPKDNLRYIIRRAMA